MHDRRQAGAKRGAAKSSRTRGTLIRGTLGRLFPVRRNAVVRVDLGLELPVSGARPAVLVEPRSVLQAVLRRVQDEAMVFGVERHGLPGHGEELVAHSEKASEGKNTVGDTAALEIDHV